MAFQHGRTSAFLITDSGAVERNLSAFLDNIDFPQEVDIPETSVFGDTARGYDVVGLKGSSISISGKFDPTATTGPDAVLAGLLGFANTSTFKYGPYGTTAGQVRYTGSCRLRSYRVSGAVDGVVSFQAEFVVDGAVTRDTF